MRIGLTGFLQVDCRAVGGHDGRAAAERASVAVELLLNPSTIVPGPLLKLPDD